MKKVFIIALAFVLILFGLAFSKSGMGWTDVSPDDVGTGVHSEKNTGTRVYSFRGSDEIVTVMNGTVIIAEDEETFSGGILEINSDEFFEGVTSYNTTFYVLENGLKKTLMSNSLIDESGGKVNPDGDDLGKISGADLITGYKTDDPESFMNNLYFEINTVGADGSNKTHQLQLEVVEVN